MTVDQDAFEDVADLASALGFLDATGQVDAGWFSDPASRMGGVLRDPRQRAALVRFVQDLMADAGPPPDGLPGGSWLPLLQLTEAAHLSLVLGTGTQGVVVSVGLRLSAATPGSTHASAILLLPLLRVPTATGEPVRFLPGSTDATDHDDATALITGTVTVGDAALRDVSLSAKVPMTAGGVPSLGVALHGLTLPGTTTPVDVALDTAGNLGGQLSHLLTTLVQAEAAAATGAVRELLGLAGLLPADGAVPPLPVGDLLVRGLPAFIDWLKALATSPQATHDWLAHIATLVGGTVSATAPYAVSLAVGRAQVAVSLGVGSDDTGGFVLTPGIALSVATAGTPALSVGIDALLLRAELGHTPSVRALPHLQMSARYGGDTGSLVTISGPPYVQVGALRAGLALDGDRRPVLVLAAERVDLGADKPTAHHHDVLDLTSPDALAEVGKEAVAGILGGLGPAGTAVNVLLGFDPPPTHATDHAWPTVSLPALVTDPIGAVAAYHRDVLALGGTGYADLLAVIPAIAGRTAAIEGSGTDDAPWSVPLVGGVAIAVSANAGVLHVGLRWAPTLPALGSGGPVPGFAVSVGLLGLVLPPAGATATPLPVSVTALPGVGLEVSLRGPRGAPFAAGDAGLALAVPAAIAALAWSPAGGLRIDLGLPGATVTVDGTTSALPVPALVGGQLVLPTDVPWPLLEALLAHALRAAHPAWVQGLPDLLHLGAPGGGLAAHLPGGLAALVNDPIGSVKALLASVVTGPEGAAALRALATRLGELAGPAGAVTVAGRGTPDDPFAVEIDTGAAAAPVAGAVEAAVWLDPAGPPTDLAALTAVLEPTGLAGWLDGTAGAAAFDLPAVAGLLGTAAATAGGPLPVLLSGRDATGAGLSALATRLSGGDGLLPGGLPALPGATSSTLAGVTHGQLSARVDLGALLGGVPDPAVTVYVTGPFTPPWPGTADRTIDLTAPGLAATAFDVTRPTTADGPWHVRLPARAACGGADADAQLAAQAARLARVVDAVGARHPGEVVLVAHGAVGQAARLLAGADVAVAKLVLLGVSGQPVDVDVLDVGPGADAFQLLRRLLPAADPATPDDANLVVARDLLGTLGQAYDSAAPATEFTPPRPTPTRTPPTWSVRGTVDATRPLAAVIRAGLAAELPAASTAAPPPTALRAGLRARLHAAPVAAAADATGVAVDTEVRLDLGGLPLAGGPPVPPTLAVTVALSRPGGWLAGGPQGVPLRAGASRTPALRQADLQVELDLTADPGVRVRFTLTDVTALGLDQATLVLGDGGEAFGPEARVLLGRLAASLTAAPANSAVAGVVDLLAAVGLIDPAAAPDVGFSVDALTRLFLDPAGQLRDALVAPSARAAAADALRRVIPTATGTGTDVTVGHGGLGLTLSLADPPTLRFATGADGVELPGGAAVAADLSVDTGGSWSGTLDLTSSGPPGPAGRPGLRFAAAAGSPPTLAVHIDGGLPGLPTELPLWPLPSGGAVVDALPVAAALLLGELGRLVLTAARSHVADPTTGIAARLDPVLTFLGLLDGSTPPRMRLPAGLFADPVHWLEHTFAGDGPGIDGERGALLVDAVRPLLALPAAPHGTLPLPGGIGLAVAKDGDGARLTLEVARGQADTAGHLAVEVDAGLTVYAARAPIPHLAVTVGPAGSTAALTLTLDGTSLGAALKTGAGDTVPLFPNTPGLGSLAGGAVTFALPLVLDRLEASAPAPIPAAVAAARTALGLGSPHVDPTQVRQLAADPAGELTRRLAANGAGALGQLIGIVRPALPGDWTVDTSDPHAVAVTVGIGPTRQRVALGYAVSPPSFRIDASVGITLPGLPGGPHGATASLDGSVRVIVDATGLRLVDATVGVDPAKPLALGPIPLAPLLDIQVGPEAVGGPHVAAGLVTGDGAHTRAILGSIGVTAPVHVAVGTRTDGTDDPTPDLGAVAGSLVLPSVVDIALQNPTVQSLLARPAVHGASFSAGSLTLQGVLTGVLLDDAGGLDTGLFALDPADLLARVMRLAHNIAAGAPSVTIGGHLTVGIAREGTAPDAHVGLGISIAAGQRVALSHGALQLSVEVDATWVDVVHATPGLSLLIFDDDGTTFTLSAAPRLVIDGVGLRVSRASGPLLATAISVGSLAVSGLLEIGPGGVEAGGARLELADLSMAPASASGGDNAVAQGLLGNAAQTGSGGDATALRPAFSPALALQYAVGGRLEWSLRAGPGDGPWWVQVQRHFGPLSIEQIGFGVDQDGHQVTGVRVLLDGGISLAGLALSVEQLSVGAHWPTATDGGPPLTDPAAWSIDLGGLAVGATESSVSLAGALRKRANPPDYVGILVAKVGPYGLTAFGGYGKYAVPGGDQFTALFVVAAVSAPIGGPPAFFITGLGGGAGVNRRLVLPASLNDFPNYPLVAALDPNSALARNPDGALDSLAVAFPPERGSFWLAAGISFTSFSLVEVVAVVAVSIGDDLQIALLGLARLALPAPEAPIAQLELALQARFALKEGVVSVLAQLTDNSWLLSPSCRLTGGFAFVSFFGANPHAGEFVLSIGGYHPAFHRDGYPVVPRVGFVWAISDVLTISGQSYFALTSEAIMAGTRFTASLSLGLIWASLTLGVDAIIYFDPFHFVADGYAAIEAGITIDIDFGWFGHLRISTSFHLGATVHVEGPNFHGSATIDLDVTSVTIAFGDASDHSTGALDWTGFSAKYLTAGGAPVLSAMPQTGQVIGSPQASGTASDDGSQDRPWRFAPEWSLAVATTVATTHLFTAAGASQYPVSQTVGIASMGIANLTSDLTIEIDGPTGPQQVSFGNGAPGLQATPTTAPLPKGVWTANPPQGQLPTGDTITAGTGALLRATATMPAEAIVLGFHRVEVTADARKLLPFGPEQADRSGREADAAVAKTFATDKPVDPPAANAAAIGYLRTGALAPGLSPLGVATFTRDRVAPPTIGLLTEGIVAPVTPAPPLQVVPPPAAPVPIDLTIYPPIVTAVLASDPGPSQRAVDRSSLDLGTVPVAAEATTVLAAAPAAVSSAANGNGVPRMPAPQLATVLAAADPAIAQALHRQAPTVSATAAGLRPPDGGPVTLRAGVPAELVRAPGVHPDHRARLDAAGSSLSGGGLPLTPGQLVVAELPNAHRDLDAAAARPELTVAGTAAVRVVALSRAGEVLADSTVASGAVPVPQHAGRVALWCVGGDGARPAGLAGWYGDARLPHVGSGVALAADAVVNGAAAPRRGARQVAVGQVPAASAVRGRGVVTTRLPADTRTVVVALRPEPGADLAGLVLGIDGARRAVGADGAEVAPTLVASGARSHLIYQLVPDPGAPSIDVSVGSDDRWRLLGVVGGPDGGADGAATVAGRLAAEGAEALLAPLLRSPAGAATVTWSAPQKGA